MNSFSHLIRFPLNSCLRSSSEIQNNCGWLVSWWQNSGSLQGADLGEGVHGGMRARRLGKGLGTGGKRQQVLPSLLHPDLLTLASAQRYFRLLQESIFARRSQWEVIPFPSVYPFTPTATLSPTIPDYIWQPQKTRGLTFNAFQTYRVLGNRDRLSNLHTGHQIRLAEILAKLARGFICLYAKLLFTGTIISEEWQDPGGGGGEKTVLSRTFGILVFPKLLLGSEVLEL